jgi:hypothetical protein
MPGLLSVKNLTMFFEMNNFMYEYTEGYSTKSTSFIFNGLTWSNLEAHEPLSSPWSSWSFGVETSPLLMKGCKNRLMLLSQWLLKRGGS